MWWMTSTESLHTELFLVQMGPCFAKRCCHLPFHEEFELGIFPMKRDGWYGMFDEWLLVARPHLRATKKTMSGCICWSLMSFLRSAHQVFCLRCTCKPVTISYFHAHGAQHRYYDNPWWRLEANGFLEATIAIGTAGWGEFEAVRPLLNGRANRVACSAVRLNKSVKPSFLALSTCF